MDLVCIECGTPASRPRKALFCGPKCKRKFYNLMIKRGQMILPLMLTGRMGAHLPTGMDPELAAYARREATALLDAWNREDRTAGRRPQDSVQGKMDMKWRAGDLIVP